MKIVFIVTALPIGGAEMALHRLLSMLDKRWLPHVVCLREMDALGLRIQALGVPIDCLGMVPSRPNPLAIWRLARLLRQLKPDVVQTWMYHADLLGGIATKLALPRCPVVWSVRHNNLSTGNTKRATILVAKLCAWLSPLVPAKVVFNSEAALRLHTGFGYDARKCTVIANGLDLQTFVPDPKARIDVRAELGLPADTPLVGMFARFDVIKNHEGFVQIAGKLLSGIPNCHFVMAGKHVDGNNSILTGWTRKAGITNHVHLLGARNDMPRLMAAINVLAMPSWSEAFPNVISEAMACGTPCVSHDVGDARHIMGDTGSILPVGDMDNFCLALERHLALSDQEMAALGARARSRIEVLFDLRQMADRYASLYSELVSA